MSRDLVKLANKLGNERVAEIIEALQGMVANACWRNDQINAMRSATNEHAIGVLVGLGIAEWTDEKRGLARWKP